MAHTSQPPILNNPTFIDPGRLNAQAGWELMKLLPYSTRQDARMQYPGMSLKEIAQLRAEQTMRERAEIREQRQQQVATAANPVLLSNQDEAEEQINAQQTPPSLLGSALDTGVKTALSTNPLLFIGNKLMNPSSADVSSADTPLADNPLADTTPPPALSTIPPDTLTPVLTPEPTLLPGGNRRDKTSFGSYIMDKIAAQEAQGKTPLSSRLIRMGAAMQGASHLGRNQAMAAMGQEYGNIEAADQRQQQLQEQALLKHQAAQAKEAAAFDEGIMEYEFAITEMDRLYGDVLAGGDDLTGPVAGTIGAWIDTLKGNPEAYTRLAMDQFKVDEILKSVAKTKGAISDREMATFERPMPSMAADEKTWLDWIWAKRQVATRVLGRLKAMRGGGVQYSAADQAIIDQYSQ